MTTLIIWLAFLSGLTLALCISLWYVVQELKSLLARLDRFEAILGDLAQNHYLLARHQNDTGQRIIRLELRQMIEQDTVH